LDSSSSSSNDGSSSSSSSNDGSSSSSSSRGHSRHARTAWQRAAADSSREVRSLAKQIELCVSLNRRWVRE
jgi:hypothetical protein